jgi:hypothetical protein
MLDPAYSIVHTMTDYYDGPRRGVADFDGVPHLYESEWSDALDDFEPTFRLSPLSADVFALALESWAIWRRWETAFHRRRATQESHPALPEDAARSAELENLLKARLQIDPTNSILATGEFRRREDPSWTSFGWAPLQVRWRRVQPHPDAAPQSR